MFALPVAIIVAACLAGFGVWPARDALHRRRSRAAAIRLALHSQRLLIRSMQLVGATNGFITRPFLGRGVMQGLIAGLIAVVLLLTALQVAIRSLPELAAFQEPEKIGMLLVGILGLGVLIGFISTFQAVHRYLGLTLDELY